MSAARETLAKAEKACESTDDLYSPLIGSSKSPESNIEDEASRMKPFPTTSTGRRRTLRGMVDAYKTSLDLASCSESSLGSSLRPTAGRDRF